MSSSNKCDSSWQEEAEAVMKDVQQHVHKISLSKLPCTNKRIFFNLTTLEKKDYCVELTPAGFRVVGDEYDSEKKGDEQQYFETPYSLLNSLSSSYRFSFEQELYQKLNQLQKERAEEEDSDEENTEEEEEEEEEKKRKENEK